MADVHYGKSPNEVVHEDASIPIVGTGGVYGRAVRPLFQGPAIVVPRKGSLGNPQYMPGPFWAADTTYAMLPKKGVQARWLHYNLDLFDLTKLNESTGVPSISRDWLYKIDFEDPGEASQKRIAEILSTVDEAIEQTKALIAKTQQIRAGLMHDLFTRGVAADGQLRPPREEAPQLYRESPLGWISKQWEVREFGSLLNGSPQNGLYKPMSDYGDTGVPIVRIDSFYDGVLLGLNTLRRLQIGLSEQRVYGLTRGDILVNRVNSIDYVGKSAIVPELHESVVFESNIMRCRVNSETIAPEFAIRWLCGGQALAHFRSRAKSAVAQASVNQLDVRCLLVPLPETGEQQRIIELATTIDATLDFEEASLSKLTRLKHGLMRDLLTGHISIVLNTGPEATRVAVDD